MWWKLRKKRNRETIRVVLTPGSIASKAANDNCFWRSLLGRRNVFQSVRRIKSVRQKYIKEPDLSIEDRMRLVEGCDVFLDLFGVLYVENDTNAAARLAPKLNRHVPELMTGCPVRELRPTERQLSDVCRWYDLEPDA